MAKFNLGKIAISESLKKKVDSESIESALARYADGDWGHVPKINARQNDYIVKTGCRGAMLAHYFASNGIEFWIMTTENEGTSVFLVNPKHKV
ncbi:MAG: hypothetical protein LBD23_00835 [Oscillospiraceae bacterium]|jgi:hypothetical protein|nr:hypothetical protein [Oscillospiraceae bacterium]